MKTNNLIIGVLTLAVVILGILLFKEKQAPTPKPTPSNSPCTFSSSDSCCIHVTSRLDDIYVDENCKDSIMNWGISVSEDSLEYVKGLINEAKRLNKYDQIYGYQISINHVRQMMKSVDEFDLMGMEDSVAGIRFYEAISERTINGAKKKKVDLVMIPYLSSGDDVYKVDPQVRSFFKMYTHFRPCPKLCGNEEEREKYIYE